MQQYLSAFLLQAIPPPELISPFLQWGLPGAVIVVLFWYILNKDKVHKEERSEWRKDMLAELDNIVQSNKEDRKEFTDAIKENTKLLFEVKATRGHRA